MTISHQHRDNSGQIGRKHVNTLVVTQSRLDESSLSQLHRNHDGGIRDCQIAQHVLEQAASPARCSTRLAAGDRA
jgi:hypothetical protein